MKARQPFFIELYNLHLSGNIPPTEEKKRTLTELFRTSHQQYSFFVSSHQSLPIVYSPTKRDLVLDWEKDYPSFLREYTHLRSFLDSYLEGTFQENNKRWFENMIQQFDWNLSTSFTGREVNLAIVGQAKDDSILALAYWELIDFFRRKATIKRCSNQDCTNIFHALHQSRIFCFERICQAKRSAESSRKSENFSRETIRIKIVSAIDAWLIKKQAQIPAAELIDEIPALAKALKKQPDLTKSLGIYLSGNLTQELLRKKGIKLTVQKVRNRNFYFLERVAIP